MKGVGLWESRLRDSHKPTPPSAPEPRAGERQQLRRFTRQSLGISKRLAYLRAAVAIYVAWYNLAGRTEHCG